MKTWIFARRLKIKEYFHSKKKTSEDLSNKGNNKITELRTILQRESQNS
jgi:hypothetical protein